MMVSAGAKILRFFYDRRKFKDWGGISCFRRGAPNCTVVGVPGRIVKMDNKKFRDPIWIKFISGSGIVGY